MRNGEMMKTTLFGKIRKWGAIALTAAIGMLMIGTSIRAQNATTANAQTFENGGFTVNWSTETGVLDKTVASDATETYKESDRQWLGLPTIARTANGRLWCAFQTGDEEEGSAGTNNYDVMYYSDDDGKTWSEEYVIFDVADESVRLTDPRLFVDADGTFWIVLIRGGGNGTYAIEMENPDCADPSENLVFKEPIWWLTYPPAHRPTILSNGVWTTPVEANVKNQSTYVCRPDKANGTYIWREITSSDGKATTGYPSNKPYGEAQIVELKDGRLMMLSRLPKGYGNGLEISYSDDLGVTWTAYESGFELPYAGPSSKFHIQRLESGNLLLINHDSLTSRTNLTAWLSEDDGKTWPYKLLLDDRQINGFWGVSYPEAAAQQGENGEIYIVYDAGRYDQKEIRLCVVTEQDIKAGEPVSVYCRMRDTVVKTGGYTDLVSVSEETSYDRYRYVEKGTAKQTVVSSLPASVQVTDEAGVSYTLTGEWKTSDYNANETGRYTFTFETSDLPSDRQDGLGLLRVYVGVGLDDPKLAVDTDTPADGNGTDGNDGKNDSEVDDGGNGCNGSIGGGIVGIGTLATAAFAVERKKKNKK